MREPVFEIFPVDQAVGSDVTVMSIGGAKFLGVDTNGPKEAFPIAQGDLKTHAIGRVNHSEGSSFAKLFEGGMARFAARARAVVGWP